MSDSSSSNSNSRTLGYLSAAPRVATTPNAAGGPRSHVLGVINGFENVGWNVKRFIVGDRVPANWSAQSSESDINRGLLRPLLADCMRMALSIKNSYQAWGELGSDVEWVYERNAVLQSLGWKFKHQGIPWILETNAPLFYEAKVERKTVALTSVARWQELRAYRSCDVLVCITDALRDVIVEEAQLDPKKIVVMPNGVDTLLFDPKNHPAKREFEGFTVGFVGKLLESQGIEPLLQAIHSLRADGLQIHATIIGNGPAKSALEATAQQLSLDAVVKFVGQISREEIPAYIAGFDVGYSGQIPLSIGVMYRSPLKLYEYMAMGKPVLAADFADASKLVGQTNAGLLFHWQTPDSLRESLRTIFERRQSYIDLGMSARHHILENHSWQTRVSRLIESVDGIIKNP